MVHELHGGEDGAPSSRPAMSATVSCAGSSCCTMWVDQWPSAASCGMRIRPVTVSRPEEIVLVPPRISAVAVNSQVSRRSSQR
ncbi:hypothetical protein [Streptomyces hokutonensis]|uniref:hypothetical protein n=1 Tax=Streptomyces hokutonensis TaxID=1306990 RepID=UPI00367901DB